MKNPHEQFKNVAPKYIRTASDLHLEWRINRDTTPKGIRRVIETALPPDELDAESVLILAGDICGGSQIGMIHDVLEGRFLGTLHVLGNHELYGQSVLEMGHKVEALERTLNGVVFSSNIGDVQVEFQNVTFYLQTLWADGGGSPLSELNCSRMQDFRSIRLTPDEPFTVQHMKDMNLLQASLIEKFLRSTTNSPLRRVVVTHHLPSYSLQDPRHSPSDYDGIFSSNQDHLLAPTGFAPASLWIHGHTHASIDRKVGDTLVICNPRGYPGESNTYQDRKFIKIEDLPCSTTSLPISSSTPSP